MLQRPRTQEPALFWEETPSGIRKLRGSQELTPRQENDGDKTATKCVQRACGIALSGTGKETEIQEDRRASGRMSKVSLGGAPVILVITHGTQWKGILESLWDSTKLEDWRDRRISAHPTPRSCTTTVNQDYEAAP